MLQLVQQYVMLTQDGIITDVCQRQHQGPEDTESLNTVSGTTCNLHQWVHFSSGLSLQLRCWQLWAQPLPSALPDLLTRLIRLTLEPTHPLELVSDEQATSKASALSPPSCSSPVGEITGLTDSRNHLTTNDKKVMNLMIH